MFIPFIHRQTGGNRVNLTLLPSTRPISLYKVSSAFRSRLFDQTGRFHSCRLAAGSTLCLALSSSSSFVDVIISSMARRFCLPRVAVFSAFKRQRGMARRWAPRIRRRCARLPRAGLRDHQTMSWDISNDIFFSPPIKDTQKVCAPLYRPRPDSQRAQDQVTVDPVEVVAEIFMPNKCLGQMEYYRLPTPLYPLVGVGDQRAPALLSMWSCQDRNVNDRSSLLTTDMGTCCPSSGPLVRVLDLLRVARSPGLDGNDAIRPSHL